MFVATGNSDGLMSNPHNAWVDYNWLILIVLLHEYRVLDNMLRKTELPKLVGSPGDESVLVHSFIVGCLSQIVVGSLEVRQVVFYVRLTKPWFNFVSKSVVGVMGYSLSLC